MTPRPGPAGLGLTAGLAAGVALGVLTAPAVAAAKGEIAPGAYCPLPEPGQKPACLAPAQQAYGEFFAAVESGSAEDAGLARVEQDVLAEGDVERAYLALSSLAYGYYRMALLVAQDPDQDPAVIARLERWNDLLTAAHASTEDPGYRDAVREAAEDLHRHSPPLGLACVDERGEPARCDSTEAVLRGLNRTRDETGVRGALGRWIDRLLGSDGS